MNKQLSHCKPQRSASGVHLVSANPPILLGWVSPAGSFSFQTKLRHRCLQRLANFFKEKIRNFLLRAADQPAKCTAQACNVRKEIWFLHLGCSRKKGRDWWTAIPAIKKGLTIEIPLVIAPVWCGEAAESPGTVKEDLASFYKLIGTVKMPVKGWYLARPQCWGMLETGIGREPRPRKVYGVPKRPVAVDGLLKYQVSQFLKKGNLQHLKGLQQHIYSTL